MPVRHILVVDDSKSVRLMMRRMLQGFGLTVDTVDSAEEALSYLRGQRPDAIFMDHTMPGLDGLAAVRRIKQQPETADIPVIMYTSKDEPSYQDEALAAGAIGVLVKPATPNALGAALEQMNALFDAAVAARQQVSVPPTPGFATSAGEVMTTGQMEKLALEKAELVVYDAIESQVLPLINDVIAKVRRDLEVSQEEKSERIVVRICEERFAQWQVPAQDPGEIRTAAETAIRSQLPPLLTEQFEVFRREEGAKIEGQVKEIAGRMYQDQMRELSERLAQQLTTRFTDATRKAEESAHEAAVNAARGVAMQAIAEAEVAKAAEVSPATIAEQVFRRLWEEARLKVWRRIYWAAGGAAAIGVVAALLVYWLR